MKPGVFYLQKLMNFMKMRTFFYKKNTSFYKKMPIVIYKKLDAPNSDLKKLNFWEEYTPLTPFYRF